MSRLVQRPRGVGPVRKPEAFAAWVPGLLLAVLVAGCQRSEQLENTTFYARKIAPTLQSCATSPTRSGCHVMGEDGSNALGNLSVESYDLLSLRRDLLVNYGPYGVPGLLLKVVPDFKLALTSWNSKEPTLITTSVAHAGDRLVDFTSPSFTTLQKWMADGAAENNAAQVDKVRSKPGCNELLGNDDLFDSSRDPTTPDFEVFADKVNPMLGERCAASNCHGSPANSLHLTCGKTPEQRRWNYFVAGDYVSSEPAASEILRRALSPVAGGTYHEGGTLFGSTKEPGYRALLEWATLKAGPTHLPNDAGFEFFATRVQPMLVKRGCMMLGCHSASMFHDYRLRGGSGGHFGLPATRKNYQLSLEQLALESPDVNSSRILRKNLPLAEGGLLHRGGPLFANRPASCQSAQAESGPLDEQSPYCVISAWIERERAIRMANAAPLSAIVYVKRAPKPGLDAPQDWSDFAPGAELVSVAAGFDAGAAISLGTETSLSTLCGLSPATSEVRRPAVSWDGSRVAFAGRVGADEPYRIYVVDAGRCAVDTAIDAPAVDERGEPVPTNGELVHDFDPSFAPDGRLVFVSTRGNVMNTSAFSYQGPQRTPADPSRLNTNLYVREADASIRQLTFLLNQELLPSFMRDGRVIFSTEKRAPNFYQLAGRRVNLDGSDYHPLFAQRSSIGFQQFSDVVELSDKNFAAIVSDRGAAHGAGTLAIVNRSMGIDQLSPEAADYLVDPSARERINPLFYQHALQIVDQRATGKLSGTEGVYATPSALPDGRLLVSYAGNVVNLGSFAGDFDVAVFDRESGRPVPIIAGPEDALWPVAVYARQNLGVFQARLDEANGSTRVSTEDGEHAEVTILDVPVFSSLLFQNTRTGRELPADDAALEVWESLPPEPGVNSIAEGGAFVTDDAYGSVYVRRALLGSIHPLSDGSAKVRLRGGMPFVLATRARLAGEAAASTHFQREEMQFYPGERARQAFRRQFFNGLCGGCHGSLSGVEVHVAANPDILTQASDVRALSERAEDLTMPTPSNVKGRAYP